MGTEHSDSAVAQPPDAPPALKPGMPITREYVIADMIRVARLSPAKLTRDRYVRLSGKWYLDSAIDKLGGWMSLLRAAGLCRPKPATSPRVKPDDEALALSPEMRMQRERVIADIIRVAGLSPVMLTRARYLRLCGNRHMGRLVDKLGGWLSLRRAAGLKRTKAPKPPRVKPDPQTLHRDIVQDIIRIADGTKLPQTAAISFRLYREQGGRYNALTVGQFGWATLCREAGWRAGNSGIAGKPDPKPGAEPTRTSRELERLLDQELGRPPERHRGYRRLMHGAARRARMLRTIERKTAPSLDRGELIADLRDVAARIGVRDLRLLTWETYYANGGQYSFELFHPFGGYDTLRRTL